MGNITYVVFRVIRLVQSLREGGSRNMGQGANVGHSKISCVGRGGWIQLRGIEKEQSMR